MDNEQQKMDGTTKVALFLALSIAYLLIFWTFVRYSFSGGIEEIDEKWLYGFYLLLVLYSGSNRVVARLKESRKTPGFIFVCLTWLLFFSLYFMRQNELFGIEKVSESLLQFHIIVTATFFGSFTLKTKIVQNALYKILTSAGLLDKNV